MSLVKDQAGNVLNTPARETINGRGERRYKDADCTTLDWFDTHPRPTKLPSAADLDADAAEKKIAEETSGATATRGDDVPQVQLPVGQLVEGLAGGQAVSGSASPSVSPAGDVPYISPYQNVN